MGSTHTHTHKKNNNNNNNNKTLRVLTLLFPFELSFLFWELELFKHYLTIIETTLLKGWFQKPNMNCLPLIMNVIDFVPGVPNEGLDQEAGHQGRDEDREAHHMANTGVGRGQ